MSLKDIKSYLIRYYKFESLEYLPNKIHPDLFEPGLQEGIPYLSPGESIPPLNTGAIGPAMEANSNL